MPKHRDCNRHGMADEHLWFVDEESPYVWPRTPPNELPLKKKSILSISKLGRKM